MTVLLRFSTSSLLAKEALAEPGGCLLFTGRRRDAGSLGKSPSLPEAAVGQLGLVILGSHVEITTQHGSGAAGEGLTGVAQGLLGCCAPPGRAQLVQAPHGLNGALWSARSYLPALRSGQCVSLLP